MTKHERGFSLVELVVVIAIMGILGTLATVWFGSYLQKANVEQQVRIMYADLMKARAQAIMQKTPLKVEVSTTRLTFKDAGTDAVIGATDLKYPIAAVASSTVQFDTLGFASGAGVPMTLCVAPVGNTPASVDGIQIDPSMIQMGKITGGACNGANIAIQ